MAHRAIERSARSLEHETAALYRQAMSRFVALTDECLARAVHAAGPSFAQLRESVDLDLRLDDHARFYFTEMLTLATAAVWTRLLDRAVPAAARQRRARRAALAYLDRLLETNASRFVNDLIERVAGSRRALEAQVRRSLADVVRHAEAALDVARRARAAGGEASRTELHQLRQARRTLTDNEGARAPADANGDPGDRDRSVQ